MKCSSDGRDFLLRLVLPLFFFFPPTKRWNDGKLGQRATLGAHGYLGMSLVHSAAGRRHVLKVKSKVLSEAGASTRDQAVFPLELRERWRNSA